MSIKCIKEDYEKVKAFYIGILGLKILREWPDGVMIGVGGDILDEIPSDPPYPIRVAFCHGPSGEEIEFFSERD